MSDRGMKKWAPYSSLIEQATVLNQMKYNKNKIEKPLLTEDQKEKINFVLTNYHGELVTIKFFHDGYLYIINDTIKKVDIENKKLILTKGKLDFRLIIDIESQDSF